MAHMEFCWSSTVSPVYATCDAQQVWAAAQESMVAEQSTGPQRSSQGQRQHVPSSLAHGEAAR